MSRVASSVGGGSRLLVAGPPSSSKKRKKIVFLSPIEGGIWDDIFRCGKCLRDDPWARKKTDPMVRHAAKKNRRSKPVKNASHKRSIVVEPYAAPGLHEGDDDYFRRLEDEQQWNDEEEARARKSRYLGLVPDKRISEIQ
ncbi:hypothetical protein CRM22_008719 [Opisthorchis felineus]|uniref:Uncharacterized protein n=1 Tax=Opisthorchis felineus TaxID=147828 RepID=A0A4S2LAN6_OPIFE|nr:hypothetical protein CRM22_008719 [Opisthorchis felineus]